MTRETVELHEAFFWICDACGSDNFERSVTVEPGTTLAAVVARWAEEEAGERMEAILSAIEAGQMVTRPDEVACGSCGAEYAVDPGGSADLE